MEPGPKGKERSGYTHDATSVKRWKLIAGTMLNYGIRFIWHFLVYTHTPYPFVFCAALRMKKAHFPSIEPLSLYRFYTTKSFFNLMSDRSSSPPSV